MNRDKQAPEDAITAAREETNRLIETRDSAGLGNFVTADVRLIGGIGELIVGREAFVEAFRTAFENPDFRTYRRTPRRVRIAQSKELASECGRWEGFGENPGSRMAGDYLAMWRRIGDEWRLQAELYVCLESDMAAA